MPAIQDQKHTHIDNSVTNEANSGATARTPIPVDFKGRELSLKPSASTEKPKENITLGTPTPITNKRFILSDNITVEQPSTRQMTHILTGDNLSSSQSEETIHSRAIGADHHNGAISKDTLRDVLKDVIEHKTGTDTSNPAWYKLSPKDLDHYTDHVASFLSDFETTNLSVLQGLLMVKDQFENPNPEADAYVLENQLTSLAQVDSLVKPAEPEGACSELELQQYEERLKRYNHHREWYQDTKDELALHQTLKKNPDNHDASIQLRHLKGAEASTLDNESCVEVYMGIVSKDETGKFKDLSSKSGDIHVHDDVDVLWVGIGNPHRALSWLHKYRLTGDGEHPVIRKFLVDKNYLKEHFEKLETEQAKHSRTKIISGLSEDDTKKINKHLAEINNTETPKEVKTKYKKELIDKQNELSLKKANEEASKTLVEGEEISYDKLKPYYITYSKSSLKECNGKIELQNTPTRIKTKWLLGIEDHINKIDGIDKKIEAANQLNTINKKQAAGESFLENVDKKEYNQFGLSTKASYDHIDITSKGLVKTSIKTTTSNLASDLFSQAKKDSLSTIAYNNYTRIHDKDIEGELVPLEEFTKELGYGDRVYLLDKDLTVTGVRLADNGKGVFSSTDEMLDKSNRLKVIIDAVKKPDTQTEKTFEDVIEQDYFLDKDETIDTFSNILDANQMTPGGTFESTGHNLNSHRNRRGEPLLQVHSEKYISSNFIASDHWLGVARTMSDKLSGMLKNKMQTHINECNKLEQQIIEIKKNTRMPEEVKNIKIEKIRKEITSKELVIKDGLFKVKYPLGDLTRLGLEPNYKSLLDTLQNLATKEGFDTLVKKDREAVFDLVFHCTRPLLPEIKKANDNRIINPENYAELGEEDLSTGNVKVNNRKIDKKVFEIINPSSVTGMPDDIHASTKNYSPDDQNISQHMASRGIKFTGGISGTTRDISQAIGITNPSEYWTFQLMNASFMIKENYHSFFEAMYVAARYDVSSEIGKEIVKTIIESKNGDTEALYIKTLNTIKDHLPEEMVKWKQRNHSPSSSSENEPDYSDAIGNLIDNMVKTLPEIKDYKPDPRGNEVQQQPNQLGFTTDKDIAANRHSVASKTSSLSADESENKEKSGNNTAGSAGAASPHTPLPPSELKSKHYEQYQKALSKESTVEITQRQQELESAKATTSLLQTSEVEKLASASTIDRTAEIDNPERASLNRSVDNTVNVVLEDLDRKSTSSLHLFINHRLYNMSGEHMLEALTHKNLIHTIARKGGDKANVEIITLLSNKLSSGEITGKDIIDKLMFNNNHYIERIVHFNGGNSSDRKVVSLLNMIASSAEADKSKLMKILQKSNIDVLNIDILEYSALCGKLTESGSNKEFDTYMHRNCIDFYKATKKSNDSAERYGKELYLMMKHLPLESHDNVNQKNILLSAKKNKPKNTLYRESMHALHEHELKSSGASPLIHYTDKPSTGFVAALRGFDKLHTNYSKTLTRSEKTAEDIDNKLRKLQKPTAQNTENEGQLANYHNITEENIKTIHEIELFTLQDCSKIEELITALPNISQTVLSDFGVATKKELTTYLQLVTYDKYAREHNLAESKIMAEAIKDRSTKESFTKIAQSNCQNIDRKISDLRIEIKNDILRQYKEPIEKKYDELKRKHMFDGIETQNDLDKLRRKQIKEIDSMQYTSDFKEIVEAKLKIQTGQFMVDALKSRPEIESQANQVERRLTKEVEQKTDKSVRQVEQDTNRRLRDIQKQEEEQLKAQERRRNEEMRKRTDEHIYSHSAARAYMASRR